jgi:hypothetical protein
MKIASRQFKNLTDYEIEFCAKGMEEVTLIRNILNQPRVLWRSEFIDLNEFAETFACWREGFLSIDELTEEWMDAYNTNFDIGYEIANNLNELLDRQTFE